MNKKSIIFLSFALIIFALGYFLFVGVFNSSSESKEASSRAKEKNSENNSAESAEESSHKTNSSTSTQRATASTTESRTESSSTAPGFVTGPNQLSENESDKSAKKQSPRSDLETKFLKALKEKTGRTQWQVTIQENSGIALTVAGEALRLPTRGIDDRIQWARFLAEQVGIRPEQLTDLGSRQEDSQAAKSFELNQVMKGYIVEDSYVRIHERANDSVIYFTTMNLQDIRTVDAEGQLTLEEAKSSVTTAYSKDFQVSFLSASQKPSLFVASQGHAVLVWKLGVRLQGRVSDAREILVSAKDGRILRELPTIVQ